MFEAEPKCVLVAQLTFFSILPGSSAQNVTPVVCGLLIVNKSQFSWVQILYCHSSLSTSVQQNETAFLQAQYSMSIVVQT